MSDVNSGAPGASKPTGVVEPTQADPKTGQQAQSGVTGGQNNAQPTGNPIKDAAQEAMRKYKVKVDGAELEVDETELLRGYGHQKAANKILQEGKLARKQAEEFISMMKDKGKLFDAIKKLGHDPRQLAEQYLAQQLEDEMMDPRDKELRDTKSKLKQIEEMERMQREAVEAKRNEALKAKYAQEYTDQFVEALSKSGLPASKPMVAEMAKYIGRAAKIGFKMTPDEAAQLVHQDLQNQHRSIIGETDGELLIKLLGEDVANKIRKWDTSRVKTPEQFLRTPEHQGEPKQRGQPSQRMSAKEWREYNRKK